jgi:hypothetical protein
VIEVLKQPLYRGFGPTLASEPLARNHEIRVGREALWQLMSGGGLWRPNRRKVEQIHTWRPRRSRFGELVPWDTSDHDWLEGRGEKISLIHMIDDATSRLRARFVRHDTTEENMRMLRGWIERYGRMLSCYTDKATMFQSTPKSHRKHTALPRDEREPLPPTQIGRALSELGIVWIAAHSPQAKGRVERSFLTAQDRLVKELRVDYQIERADIVLGLCGARLRIEERLDGTMAVAFQGKYLRYRKCEPAPPVGDLEPVSTPVEISPFGRSKIPHP